MRQLYKYPILLLTGLMCVLSVSAQGDTPHWTCDAHSFEHEMAVYFNIDYGGTTVANLNGYEVAAFCGEECRGVSEVVAVGEATVGYIRVRSNATDGEVITFMAFNKSSNQEFQITENITFAADQLIGLPSSPKLLHIYIPATPTSVQVSAVDVTREYGEENPNFTYTSSGDELEGAPALTCDATPSSPVGTYPIVVAVGSITNDDVTLVDGTLTVTAAPLTISVGSYEKIQGEENPEFACTYEGFKNGETESVLTALPQITCSATNNSEPGEYEINISGASADNYVISYVVGKLTVKAKEEIKPITVTAVDVTRVYGDENPSFTYTVSGGELNGEPTVNCDATPLSPVGTYPVVVAVGSITNDNVTFVNGTLTVTPAPLAISVGSYEKIQGEENPEFACTYEGFKNGETESVLTAQPQITCPATTDSEPGEYEISVSGASAENYTINYVAGKLTIKVKQEETTSFEDESGNTVAGNIVTTEDGKVGVVVETLPEDMLNGTVPIPAVLTDANGGEYSVLSVEAEAFANMPQNVIIALPEGMETTEPVVNVINGDGTCETLDLTYIESYNVTDEVDAGKVIYLRDLESETFTVCLPYNLEIPEGAIAYVLTSGKDGIAGFERYEGLLEAYKPYVLQMGSAQTNGRVSKRSGVEVIDLGAKNVHIYPVREDEYIERDELYMYGIVSGLSHKEGLEKKAHILQPNNSWEMTASEAEEDLEKTYLPAFHAYLCAKTDSMTGDTDIASNFIDTTGITEVELPEGKNVWYDIQGRKLNGKPKQSGIYFHNGRKVICRK